MYDALPHTLIILLGSMSALMTCCTTAVQNREQDVEKCARLLLQHGADVNSEDRYVSVVLNLTLP